VSPPRLSEESLAPRTAKEVAEIEALPRRALDLLTLLFDRDCQVYAHEITIPMRTHSEAYAALRSVRELLAKAKGHR